VNVNDLSLIASAKPSKGYYAKYFMTLDTLKNAIWAMTLASDNNHLVAG